MRELRIPVTQFVHTGFVGSTVGRKKMTWPQLIELDRSGLVTIASQTVTHPADLTKMKSKDVLAEFMKSKQQLEFKLGHRITQLAYPNGKFDNRISDLAKQAGFTAAFTEECLPSETGKNQFQIPRYVHTKIRIAWNSKAATP
jgi:peptidoglycan/xylan/chitin deacetylase (PgdA/CDA1 family)